VCHLATLSTATLYSVGDRRTSMEKWWNDTGQGKTEVQGEKKKTCLSATLSGTNPTA